MSEARTGKRFPLELPIKIHKADEGGQASGVTGNLSAAGVYIRADAALEMGSTVEFEIALPPEVTGAKENVIDPMQRTRGAHGRTRQRQQRTAEARAWPA